MKIIIPARMGSKGLPLKNRILFEKTAQIVPDEFRKGVWVSTDDPEIARMSIDHGFHVIDRPKELATDDASTRDVLVHAIEEAGIQPSEIIVMLYLTYPERTWEDVQNAMEFFFNQYQLGIANSMLCKKEVKSHPYLCLVEHGVGGVFGKQLVQHDLCRRQEYPPCFEISHFVCILRADSIYTLNRNLYGEKTVFFQIKEVVDVDTQADLEKIHN
jgi:N-acylneuraminate cytidylyltransferase